MTHPSAPENVARDLEVMMKVYSYIDSSGGDAHWLKEELEAFEPESDEDEEILADIFEMFEEANAEFDNPTDDHEHLMDVVGYAMEQYDDGEEANAIQIARKDVVPVLDTIHSLHVDISEQVRKLTGSEGSELLRAAEYNETQYEFMRDQMDSI